MKNFKFAKRSEYDKVCHELGFLPCGFVEITNRGTITFSIGKPHEVRKLYQKVIEKGYKPAKSLERMVKGGFC